MDVPFRHVPSYFHHKVWRLHTLHFRIIILIVCSWSVNIRCVLLRLQSHSHWQKGVISKRKLLRQRRWSQACVFCNSSVLLKNVLHVIFCGISDMYWYILRRAVIAILEFCQSPVWNMKHVFLSPKDEIVEREPAEIWMHLPLGVTINCFLTLSTDFLCPNLWCHSSELLLLF